MPEPIDPDVQPDVDPRAGRHEWDVLLAVAIGGVLGAEARYGTGRLLPHSASDWPWSTLFINVIGSAVLAVLMAVIAAHPSPPRLLRPFVGVGICGGFTTFSTFSVDAIDLARAGRVFLALAYVLASVGACVVGVVLAGRLVRSPGQRSAPR